MRPRSAFTLIEVLLAMVLTALVLGAVYSFIGYQLRQASAGREVVERATLARAILHRFDTDARAAVTLVDPGRFRRPSSSGSSGSGSSNSGANASGSSGASGAGASSSPAASSGSTSGASGGSGSSSSSSSGGSDSSSSSGGGAAPTPIQLPLGVVGTGTCLHLFISRPPTDGQPATTSSDAPPVAADLRRVSYWVGEGGLYRMELPLVTSDQAGDTSELTGDNEPYLFAAEVRSVEFSYYDGSSWNDSWDSTTTGPDGSTPQGSPRAIAMKIGVKQPGARDGELKYYRHVVPLLTANGTPLNQNAEGGANPTP